MNSNTIQVRNLTVAYDSTVALESINLSIPKGVLMAVIGPNGAGKSTLIKTIAGIIKPTHGSISIGGQLLGTSTENIAYVPQRTSIDWDFPATVHDVVIMGTYKRLGWFRRPGKKEINDVNHCLSLVGMSRYANTHIKELSGGQQQRVFIARALVQQADIFLLDEPFQGIDIQTEKTILKILEDLHEEGRTVIVVHHDLSTVNKHFKQVAIVNKRLIASGVRDRVLNKNCLECAYGGPLAYGL